MFDVNSNFNIALNAADGDVARRFYVNSIDYSNHVQKWPIVKRDWNSVRSTTVSISLENTSQLFNFFHADKTRLKDAVDVDYGVRYKSHNLLTYSHIYSATDWSAINAAIISNDIANPINQEEDVDKLLDSTDTNTHHGINQTIPNIKEGEDSTKFWNTAYVKPGEVKSIVLTNSYRNNWSGRIFDVESGTLGAEISQGQLDPVDAFIRQSTNGYWHCAMEMEIFEHVGGSSTLNAGLLLCSPISKSDYDYTGTGSDGLYVYGHQVQESRYRESDIYFMTGATRQRPYGMNLGKYTDVFSSSEWSKGANIFVTLNNSVAPDGSVTAALMQNSNTVNGFNSFINSLTIEETATEDYWCAAIFIKAGAVGSGSARFLLASYDASSSTNIIGHQLDYRYEDESLVQNKQWRTAANSGMSWISVGSVEQYRDSWNRLWCTFKKPIEFLHNKNLDYSLVRAYVYPSISPYSGTSGVTGFSLEKGGRELLSGPSPYVAVHSGIPIYPSNAEDMVNIFDGTIRDANYSRGKLKLQAKDKFRFLSEHIVGTGETPIAVDSITPSWLAFTLCSCYGGMDATSSTANPDIDWSSVDSWNSYNESNVVHVKTDLRGMKVTEALKRIGRMTRTAIYIENDKVTFRRWTNVATQITTLNNNNMLDVNLSVNDENLVNKQWIFGDWDEASNFYQLTLFDEDTASQNSFGLHEKIIKDKAIFYTSSAAALDTAQRIVANEAEPIDRVKVTSFPSVINMQIGESISINDPLLEVAGTFRIMGSKIDMNKDRVSLDLDNSQLILGNPFILDTSSLGGTDILS